MGSTFGTWGDALVKLADPYRQTVEGLWALGVGAGIGTLIVGLLLLLISLEFLRTSRGAIKTVGRLASIASAAFILAAVVYGDFLAGPAKAAYSLISERAGTVAPETAALTTVGVAGVGVLAYVGRRSAINTRRNEETRWQPRRYASMGNEIGELSRLVALDPAGRLHLRAYSRNAKKDVQTVKPMRGMRRA